MRNLALLRKVFFALLRYLIGGIVKKTFKSIPVEPEVWREMQQEKLDSGRDIYQIIRDVWKQHRSGAGALQPLTRVPKGNPWIEALAYILASGDRDAISAVQQNIVIFYGRTGGNESNLPPVDAPRRGWRAAAKR